MNSEYITKLESAMVKEYCSSGHGVQGSMDPFPMGRISEECDMSDERILSKDLEKVFEDSLHAIYMGDQIAAEKTRDENAAAIARTILTVAQSHNESRAALRLLSFMSKAKPQFPKTKTLLWEAVIKEWLSAPNVIEPKRGCLVELVNTQPEGEEAKVFESLLRTSMHRHVNEWAYRLFFDYAPRECCERYPAIRIIGQEFVRDHPNCFMGKFTVGGG